MYTKIISIFIPNEVLITNKTFKGLNMIEFSERFATDDNCSNYLSEIK